MPNPVTITITSKNGTQQTFQAIGNDAGILAGKLEQAGVAGSQSFEKIGSAIGKLGLAFGGFTLIADKAAGDSEASAARMETAFTNAGQQIENFRGQIDSLNSTGLRLGF